MPGSGVLFSFFSFRGVIGLDALRGGGERLAGAMSIGLPGCCVTRQSLSRAFVKNDMLHGASLIILS